MLHGSEYRRTRRTSHADYMWSKIRCLIVFRPGLITVTGEKCREVHSRLRAATHNSGVSIGNETIEGQTVSKSTDVFSERQTIALLIVGRADNKIN